MHCRCVAPDAGGGGAAGAQLMVVFSRVGVYIPVPGVDVDRFAESMRSGAGLLGYIDQLSGGSLSKVGIFSLGAPSPPNPPLPSL